MKETALASIHKSLNAKMVPFAGYNMPVSYEGVNVEHQNVRENLGVFDVSHMSFVVVVSMMFSILQHFTITISFSIPITFSLIFSSAQGNLCMHAGHACTSHHNCPPARRFFGAINDALTPLRGAGCSLEG